MRAEEYSKYDGIGLAELVKGGDVTSRELADAALAAIDDLEPQISALVDVFRDDVSAIPQDAQVEGPFGGVPFIIKDCLLMMEGKPLLNGSRLCEGLTAPHDTDLMKRFRAAGVSTVAMSKCPEFAYSPTTEPIVSSPVHNPWRRGFSAGGSSGGAAAAVAAGYVPIAHGNDGGGSIRIPAAACGLVGLKPTRGRNPLGPDFGEALFGMSCEGILSRSVRDTAMMLDCTSGPGVGDPYQIPKPANGFFKDLESAPRRLKIAIASAPAWAPAPEAEVSNAVLTTAKLLEDLGHTVIEAEPTFDTDQMARAASMAWLVGETAWINATATANGRTVGPDTLERVTWNLYQEGSSLNAIEALQTIWGGFNAVSRSVAPFFEDYDVLLTPTLSKAALPHGELNQNADISAFEWWMQLATYMPYTPLFNVTGQPAISLPLVQSTDGMPIGLQLVGGFGEEALLLRLSRQLEIAAPWSARHPGASIWKS